MIEMIKKWERKRLILLILCMICSGLFFVSFMYSDILETTRDGMTFWDALFAGRIRDFYIMNEDVVISSRFGTSGAAIYDFPVYFVFAVWNFPLWLYEHFSGEYALDRLLGVLWAKSISLPFLAGINLVMIKIGKQIKGTEYDVDLSILMFGSSVLLFVPVLVMGQYDAFCLLFILLGVDAYISGRQKQFIVWFAVAAAFKLFAFFVFIPLVLLKEKKLIRMFAKLGAGCLFLAFWKIVQKFFFVVSDRGTDYVSGHLLTFIFQSQTGMVYGTSSIFVAVFLLVCMYCYFKAPVKEEETGIWAIYVSFMGLASFFVTSLTHPQWSLLLLPFTVLLVLCRSQEERKTGMWISTIFSTGLLLAEFIYYYWVFNVKTSVYTLAGKLFYNEKTDIGYSIRNSIENKLVGFDINYLNLIGGGIFVGGILFFLYWAHPDTGRAKFARLECSVESILIVRELVLIGSAGLLIALML